MTLFALGLGDITVNSYLDQPFSAEIELLDVGNTKLSDIQARLASVDDYEKMGLEQGYALSYLSFHVEKNQQGRSTIQIRSTQRISEPYLPLLIDLAWLNGQVYRSYAILLDPPNYRISVMKEQLRNQVKRASEPHNAAYSFEKSSTGYDVDHKDSVEYGPTVAHETVWQIAQRYKTDQMILQQMILAIVGMNPQAFTEGNLNGLKAGVRLLIPTTFSAAKVPAALAKLEVIAHDNAWHSRQTIQHALLPPYINSSAPIETYEKENEPLGYPLSLSVLPSLPEINPPTSGALDFSSVLPVLTSFLSPRENKVLANHPTTEIEPTLFKKQTTPEAMTQGSPQAAHVILMEQFKALQKENKHLQKESIRREKEIERLRDQIRLFLTKQALTGKTPQQQTEQDGDVWFFILFFLGLGFGGGFVYWWLWVRLRLEKKTPFIDTSHTPPLEPAASTVVQTLASSEPAVFEEKQDLIFEDRAQEQSTSMPNEAQTVHVIIEETTSTTPVVPIESEVSISMDLTDSMDLTEESSSEELLSLSPKQPIINDDHAIEFVLELPEEQDAIVPEKVNPKHMEIKKETELTDLSGIDFVVTPTETLPENDTEKPVKSKAALETLLALSKTYIEMDDIETAKQSLQEVLDGGNEKQRKAAEQLLDELIKKSS
jgi:pilus assembly protein FimV